MKLIIKAEVDKAIKDLNLYNTTTKKAETATDAFAKAASIASRTLATAGLGISLGMIENQLNEFAKDASLAEETASKFSVIYRDIAGQADEIAKKYAKAYGVAESTSKTLLGNVGDLLTGMGATQDQALDLSNLVTRFGSDLASFTNYYGGTAGAVDALTKMMLGEREMVKSLGIVIREADVQQRLFEKGQKDLTGQAKLLATAQASLELAMEQSKNAIGDYERTADSTANTSRRFDEALKESREIIGAYVNEGLTPVKSELADIIEKYNDAAKAKRDFDEALETGDYSELDFSVAQVNDAIDAAEGAEARLDSKIAQFAQMWTSPLGASMAIARDLQTIKDAEVYKGYQEFITEQLSLQVMYSEQQLLNMERQRQKAAQIAEEQAQYDLSLEGAMDEKRLLVLDRQEKKAEEISQHYQDWAELQNALYGNQELKDFLETPISLPAEIYTDKEVLNAQLDELKDSINGLWANQDEFSDITAWQTDLDALIARYLEVRDQIDEIEEAQKRTKRIEDLRYSLLTDEEKSQKSRVAFEKEILGYLEQKLITEEEYQALLASQEAPDAFASMKADLEKQLKAIDRTAVGYADLSKEGKKLATTYDAAGEKSEAVRRAFEEIANSVEYSDEQLQEFLATYGALIELDSEPLTGFAKLKQQFEDFGWEDFTENLENELSESLIDSLNTVFGEVGQMIGSGEFDGEALSQSIISTGTSLIAAAAGPYAPLVYLAGGVLEGLNSAIFGTIEVSREAQKALDDANDSIQEMFLDVLDMEEELKDQRLEAIEEEMDLLEQNRDLRLEILRDQWQSGQISAEDYFNQATQINSETAASQEAFENQETMITGLDEVISTLQEELDGMSGWDKFWSGKDEKLAAQIAEYQALLSRIAGDEDGLTDEEIQALASQYHIDIPAAATGADFITSGPQLLMVGDNPGGQERVQVSPITSPNLHGPSSEPVVIQIQGDVYGIEDLYQKLDEAGKELRRTGRVSA